MNGRIIAGGLGLALLASTAFAQDAPPPPPPAPDAGAAQMGAPPPPPDRMGERGPDRGPGPHGRGPREGRGWPTPPPPSKAAEFRFRQGPLEMRVRCSEYEPIQPCADAALTLMDKFGAVAASMPMPPRPPGDRPAPPPPGAVPAPQPAPAQ